MLSKISLSTTIILFFFAFIPSFIFVVFNQSSITLGIMISIFFVSLYQAVIGEFKFNYRVLVLSLWIMIWLFITSYSNIMTNPTKVGLSVFFVFLYLNFAYQLSIQIKKNDSKDFFHITVVLCRVLLFIGIVSLFFKLDVLGYSAYSKSIFTFYEPSHYALVLVAFLMPSFYIVSYKEKLLYFFILLCFGLVFPSVIILIVAFLSAFSILNKRIFLLSVIGAVLGFLMITPQTEQLLYFYERLNFSENTSNLTALVYMQGWYDAYYSFIETTGIGLGFQMAGENTETWINYRIYDLSGGYMNRNDGSFTASKLISEFGVLGVFFVLSYLIVFIKSIRAIKNGIRNKNIDFSMISNFFIISYVIEMFFRSAGYFTIGTLMLFVGIMLRYFGNAQINN
ncbi:hypothetical protein GCM10007987_04970 [Aliivibrio fischeri]|nr:hypothetical protein GCM10007987_04970 [Aliivibrio fischeri]